MKTTISLVNPLGYNPKTKEYYRDTRVISGICKSDPPHPMDTDRLIHASFWSDGNTYAQDLEKFKLMLKDRIYKNENLEIEIIDKRDLSLPHKDMY